MCIECDVNLPAASAQYDPRDPLSVFRFRFPFLSVIVNKWPADQQTAFANQLVGGQAGGQAGGQGQVNGQWGQAAVNGRRKRQISWGAGQAARSGQAAHGQLIDFGENTGKNLDYVGDSVKNGWMDFHHMFDGHLENGHKALIGFGRGVEGLLGRVSPGAAGLWNGFQAQVDKDINTGKGRLEGFGNMVGDNLQHGKKQVGNVWQGVRDNVDEPLRQGLGALTTPKPLSVKVPQSARL